MTTSPPDLERFYAETGLKPLHPVWAKLEIALGLFAVGSGLGLEFSELARPAQAINWLLLAGGLILFVLGGYLTMAGHRSHLYQSNNKLAAYLLEQIRWLQDKVEPR